MLSVRDDRLRELVRENVVWILLAIVFGGFSLLIPIFDSVNNIQALLYGSAALGAVVMAESVCLLSGHFDLSVGSITGFSAITTGVILAQWFPGTPGIVGIAIILAIGGTIGLLNGVSVAYVGVNPFLQTLSFLIIFSGAIEVVSTATMINLPDLYMFVGGGKVFGTIPFAVVLMAVIIVCLHLFLVYTPTGRAIYAVGSNKQAAEEAGIDVQKVVLGVYVFSGVMSGLGGLLYTGYIGAASPTIGGHTLFPAFAASIIGGISLFGGRGKVTNAVGGILLLATIQVGLVLLNMDPTVVKVVNGTILLGAILLYTAQKKRTDVSGD